MTAGWLYEYYALRAGVCVTLLKFNFLRRVSRNLPKHKKTTMAV
jgi:hypothetical protein